MIKFERFVIEKKSYPGSIKPTILMHPIFSFEGEELQLDPRIMPLSVGLDRPVSRVLSNRLIKAATAGVLYKDMSVETTPDNKKVVKASLAIRIKRASQELTALGF